MAFRFGTAPKPVTVDGFEIECTVSYEPVHEAEVTEHPVEQGANISDHIRTKPISLSLEGCQSAAPIGSQLSEDAQAARPGEAYDFLVKLFGRIVTVSTELKDYENMALTRLSAPRDASTGEVLNFTCAFKQVRVVSNLTVEEPTELKSAKSVKDLGKKPTKPAPEPTVNRSLAKGLKLSILGGP